MRRITRFLLRTVAYLAVVLVWAAPSSGQSHTFLMISPEKVTLLVGESRSFRLVDQNGHIQHDVAWSISDSDAFQVEDGDELTITAKDAGDFRLSARSKDGSAEASIRVMEGESLPIGTVKWSSGAVAGCKTTKIIPAVPSPNGPDVYEQSQCEDGQYIAAYTVDGIQMWRRKIGDGGAAVVESSKNEAGAERLNLRARSICDSVAVGTEQQKVRELLRQHNVLFREGPSSERVWSIEEPGTQCKLWFDDKLILTKKRKIIVGE